ncbi:MAG: NUMOD3 domain-containing DNA-binding protein [Paludibacteraceae bacterium]|nr:NUMOD3 domain-containing DNA-binding protein [Paludibacteraceae bacterium]
MKWIVYVATNKINGKKYVGQTKVGIEKRKASHLAGSLYGDPYAFANAIRKYGINSFFWEILVEDIGTQEELDRIEIEKIKELKTLVPFGYNISMGGGGGDTFENNPRKEEIREHLRIINTGKKLSQETKLKMSISRKGNKNSLGTKRSEETKRKTSETMKKRWEEGLPSLHGHPMSETTRKKLSDHFKGRIVSDETRKKMSLSQKGKKVSDETREKIRNSKIGKKHSKEFCKATSERTKGAKNPFWGKKHTLESKQRKLTVEMVKKIKHSLIKKPDGMTLKWLCKTLSEEYGVGTSAIMKIKTGETWSDVYIEEENYENK